MTLRFGLPVFLLFTAVSIAGDGIPARGSAADYAAHVTAGNIEIGASYVPPSQAKKLFGDDLDKHGYVVFEVGVFPSVGLVDVSPDDFKLRQGKDPSIIRPATPHMVAAAVHPGKSHTPSIPGNVDIHGTETIGYDTGPYGRGGVYTGSTVSVGRGSQAPPPPPPSNGSQGDLEQQLDEKGLPAVKTHQIVAGYLFFPKPTAGKNDEFELLYFGADGQVKMRLSPVAKAIR